MIKKNLYASWIAIFAYKGFICDASMEQGEGVSIPSKDQIKSKQFNGLEVNDGPVKC